MVAFARDYYNNVMYSTIKKIFLTSLYLILISSTWLVGWLAINAFNQKYPVTRLKLSGQLDYIAPLDIQSSITDLLNNNLWTINVNKVKDRIYGNPWVQHVFVNKLWPDILKVEIEQYNPIAKWNDSFFLTFSGKKLPSSNHSNVKDLLLPTFYGQDDQEILVVETYLLLLEKLTPFGLFVSKIEIMPDQNIQVILNNNVMLKLGTFDLLDRIDRFVMVYKKKLQPIISDISYIDLRYTNGVAVGWAQNGGGGS